MLTQTWYQWRILSPARRKFYETQQSDAQRSTYALEKFTEIYCQERIIREHGDTTPAQAVWQQEKILLILQEPKAWIEAERVNVLSKSPMRKARTYYQPPWLKLEATVRNGRFDRDQNRIENTIHPLALGRENSLSAGSHGGAERNAMMYSFMASCKSQNINPRQWLEDILQRIGQHPVNKLKELLPGYAAQLSKV